MVQNSTSNFSITFNKHDQIQRNSEKACQSSTEVMALSWTGDELFYEMADVYSSNAWELFFNSRLSVLDGCDSVPHTSLEREILGMR